MFGDLSTNPNYTPFWVLGEQTNKKGRETLKDETFVLCNVLNQSKVHDPLVKLPIPLRVNRKENKFFFYNHLFTHGENLPLY